MRILLDPSKEELSTLVGIGTFYFGPTLFPDVESLLSRPLYPKFRCNVFDHLRG
jgi:hypothetical protein